MSPCDLHAGLGLQSREGLFPEFLSLNIYQENCTIKLNSEFNPIRFFHVSAATQRSRSIPSKTEVEEQLTDQTNATEDSPSTSHRNSKLQAGDR